MILGGIFVSKAQLVAGVVAGILALGMHVLLTRTALGSRMLAVAEDRAPRPHRGSGPHVARELRQLLQEIEGAR